MSMSWFERTSPRTKFWWVLFFTLFPLAYVGGVMLEVAEESPARIAGAQDRAASIRIAERFAASKGYDVAGWSQYAITETRDNLLYFYGDAKEPDLAAASQLAPAREVQVLFRSTDRREFRVYLSLTGQITGYEIGKSSRDENVTSKIGILNPSTTAPQATGDDAANASNSAAAEAVARQELAANSTLNRLLKLGPANVGANSDDPARADVKWEASLPNRPGFTLHIKLGVRNSRVVANHMEGGVDKRYVREKPKLPIFLNVIYGSFLAFCTFYAMFRYAKRTLQKEVSHTRTLVVAALFAVSDSVNIYSLVFDQVATRVGAETFAKVALFACIFSAVVILLMGLLVGLAYGSGEGEVREAFPGKLTSLDALLAGRIFSRDVALSLLFGLAAAGWLLLLHQSLGFFFRTDIADSRSHVLTYTFARLPWLTLLVGKQFDSLLIAVGGLLLPASFLLRTGSRKRRRFAWLIVFALCSVMHDAAAYSTLGAATLAMVIFAGALLLPFFAFDLLAAMVSLSALSFAGELAQLAAVFPSWTGFAVSFAALATAILLVAAYLAQRGRPVRQEDVRPLYAKNLAERMSMQAEVLAAREAQLRLLPQAAPAIQGVQMAAVCLPARGVGGDFYDFFLLDSNRVGIFVAQGGDQGLASALCIALAKGILMHNSLQPGSPTQIVIELEASLSELLEGGSTGRLSFAYGVVDTRRNILNYARLGSSPRLVIHRAATGLHSSAQLERQAMLPERSKSAPAIYEGAAHLETGDLVVFYTDGVTALRARRFAKREFQWLDILRRELAQPDESIQNSLASALSKYQRQATNDLTAVVLRMVRAEVVAQEVVA